MSRRSGIILFIGIVAAVVLPLGISFAPGELLNIASPLFCKPGERIVGSLSSSTYDDDGDFAGTGINCTDGERYTSIDGQMIMIMVVGSFAPFLLFFGSLMMDSIQHNNLLRNGEPGVGRITDVSYTGVRINNVPVYNVHMMIYTYGQAPYEASARKRMGYYGISGSSLAPGMIVAVKYDRNRPTRVAIDSDNTPDAALAKQAAAAGGVVMTSASRVGVDLKEVLSSVGIGTGDSTPDLKDRLEQLKEAYDSGLITTQEYEQRRKEILEEL